MFDVFIAYKGTEDPRGCRDTAESIYKWLVANGKKCYIYNSDGSADYGETWRFAKESKRFILVVNDSIRSDLDDTGALKANSQIYTELVHGFLTSFSPPASARRKVRVVCCKGFSPTEAGFLYPPVTSNIEHLQYNDDDTNAKLLNWINGRPDNEETPKDSKNADLNALFLQFEGLKETVEAIGDYSFLSVISLPQKSTGAQPSVISLERIKRGLLGTRYAKTQELNYPDYMEEISEEVISNPYTASNFIFLNASYPKYFNYLYSLNGPVMETACLKVYYQYLFNNQKPPIHARTVMRHTGVRFNEHQQIITSIFGYIDSKSDDGKNDLICSEDQYRNLKRNDFSPYLQSAFDGTVIFIDFDKDSKFFQNIHWFIGYKDGRYPFKAYLVHSEASSVLPERSYDKKKNIEELPFTAETLFNALLLYSETRNLRQEEVLPKKILPANPYMYLSSFEEQDKDWFFGRENVIDELLTNIMRSDQVTVLSAESGFGKTSVINAGIIPKIKESEHYEICKIRSRGTPWLGVSRKVFEKTDEVTEDDFVRGLNIQTSPNKRLLVIIDQFEELFALGTEKDIATFNRMVPAMLDKFPSLKLLISVRSDFLPQLMMLDFIKERLSGIFVQLPALQEEEARKAISRPLSLIGWKYEEGLVDTILNDIRLADDGQTSHFVDPTQLQIVCDKLYRTQKEDDFAEKTITIKIYESLGRAKGILDTFIEGSIENFEQSKDFELMKHVMKCMITSRNTKVRVSEDEVVDSIVKDKKSFSKDSIGEMLNRLVASRLLKAKTIDGVTCYELSHEYLIRKINQWFDEQVFRIKECQELLTSEHTKWTRQRQQLMNVVTLSDILQYRDQLVFSQEHSAFILANIIDSFDLQMNSGLLDDLAFFININHKNAFASEYLTWLLQNRQSNRTIMLAYVALTIVDGPQQVKDYALYLEEKVNPFIKTIFSVLERRNIEVNSIVKAELLTLLSNRRIKDMVSIDPHNPIELGLNTKAVSALIDQLNISPDSRKYFPEDIRSPALHSYWIDKYLVTNADYKEFKPDHNYRKGEEDFPVVNLSFDEATAFAHWWGKTLPDEDEWEYAARGENAYTYPWGNDWDPKEEDEMCRQGEIEESGKRCNTSLSGTDGLTSVKDYPRGVSPFGCFNMSGTVWEWTCTTSEHRSDSTIVKGGSWSEAKIYPWTWYRYFRQKKDHQQNIGFRCVLREK